MQSVHHQPTMDAQDTVNLEKCPNCGGQISASLRYCPSCATDVGCPNVRAAEVPKEVDALTTRFDVARNNAESRELAGEFDSLVSEVDSASFVVVTVPLLIARNLFSDPKLLYSGYEKLISGGIRVPAAPENDSERFSVAGKLFGSYAGKINYGILALTNAGLPNYGRVFMRLRKETVQHRVSFLHENSYVFLKRHAVSTLDDIPVGFRSTWSRRSQLVGAKLEPALKSGSNTGEWAKMLVAPGKKRDNDQFVEAHIYGNFNAESVHSVQYDCEGAKRDEKNDIKAIEELIAKRDSVGEKK